MSSWNNVYYLISRTTNCRLYRNILQILLLYKVWSYYNKFYSLKSSRVYYRYVKMPRCGCVEHGLEYVLCSKTYSTFGGLFWIPIGAPAFVKLVYFESRIFISTEQYIGMLSGECHRTSPTRNQPYQLVFPIPLTPPFLLKYVMLLGFANQASLLYSRLPGESNMSEQPLFCPVVFWWLCNQMQSAWEVAAVKLLTF